MIGEVKCLDRFESEEKRRSDGENENIYTKFSSKVGKGLKFNI